MPFCRGVIYEAAKYLNCGIDTLDKLHNSGILLPENKLPDKKKWRYSKISIDYFTQNYITSNEVAELLSWNAPQVTRWAKMGWLKAVSGPEIDNAHAYRFKREYIINWRTERLLTEEVMASLGIKRRTLENWVSKGILLPLKGIGQHPYWFSRFDVMDLAKRRSEESTEQKEIENFIADLANILKEKNFDEEGIIVSDILWNAIEQQKLVFHPSREKTDPRTIDDREVISTVIWLAKNKSSRQKIPRYFPSRRTCVRRLKEWNKTGFLKVILALVKSSQ